MGDARIDDLRNRVRELLGELAMARKGTPDLSDEEVARRVRDGKPAVDFDAIERTLNDASARLDELASVAVEHRDTGLVSGLLRFASESLAALRQRVRP